MNYNIESTRYIERLSSGGSRLDRKNSTPRLKPMKIKEDVSAKEAAEFAAEYIRQKTMSPGDRVRGILNHLAKYAEKEEQSFSPYFFHENRVHAQTSALLMDVLGQMTVQKESSIEVQDDIMTEKQRLAIPDDPSYELLVSKKFRTMEPGYVGCTEWIDTSITAERVKQEQQRVIEEPDFDFER